MLSALLSMLVFALVGAASPGPVNIIAASTGAQFGYRKALSHVSGATVAYTFIVCLCGLGLEQASSSLPEIIGLLKMLGGAFLLYMSFKIATATGLGNKANVRETTPPSFTEGALSQMLNPKAWLFAMSAVSLYVLNQSSSMLYLLCLGLISFIACFTGVSVWAAAGEVIGQYLSTARRQTTFNLFMGTLLSGTVITMLMGY